MKTNKSIVTISINGEIHNKAKEILKKEGFNFSFWVERCCREIIRKRNNQKEVK